MTSSEESDVVLALTMVTHKTKTQFVEILKSVLCKNQFQFEVFENYYKEFLFEIEKVNNSKIKKLPDQDKKPQKQQKPSLEDLKKWVFYKWNKTETAIACLNYI